MERNRLYRVLKRLEELHGLARTRPWLAGPLRAGSHLAYVGLERLLGGRHPHVRTVRQARALFAQSPPLETPADAARVR